VNFYKRHLGDYSKDTPHLPMIEHGAYALLLDYYYATERPLPAEITDIYRFTRAVTKGEQKAVQNVVAQFFPISADGLRHNKRADEEIGRSVHQREINREVGKRGGRPRTEQETESVSGSESESQEINKPNRLANRNPSHKPLAISQNPVTKDLKNLKPLSRTPRDRSKEMGKRLPKDWQLPDSWKEWAQKERPMWSEDDVHKVAETFRDHWLAKAGAQARKVDWELTWRNWVRKEPEMKGGNGKAPWWANEQATLCKAKELGIEARPGEEFHAFRDRIRQRLSGAS
jgi:uncharacterized protein YdaU (DUF1376 family)